MTDENEKTWFQRNRHKLGLCLTIGGIVPWVLLMVYIVYIKTPGTPLIALTFLCWGVFFIGKTLLKTRDVPQVERDA